MIELITCVIGMICGNYDNAKFRERVAQDVNSNTMLSGDGETGKISGSFLINAH